MRTKLENYLEYLQKNKKLSQNTVDAYKRDLNLYLTYLSEHEKITLSKVRRSTIYLYETYLRKLDRSSASIARALASIKGFHQYLSVTGTLKNNPAAGIAAPQKERKLPGILTNAEIDRFLSQPTPTNDKGIRDKAMLELLYATGIRVSELVTLKVSDVHFQTELIHCQNRDIPFGSVAANAIKKYLASSPYHASNEQEQYLFLNLRGEPLTRQGVWKIIKQYKDMAEIEKEITPQTLRHSFATHLLENGADLDSLQELLGYAAISSTQVYADLTKNHLKSVYKKAHPRA